MLHRTSLKCFEGSYMRKHFNLTPQFEIILTVDFDPSIAVLNPSSLTFTNEVNIIYEIVLSDERKKILYGPQHEKMYLRTIFRLLEKQSYFECITFPKSNSLYLTRLFKLFRELRHIFYMDPLDVIVLKK